MTGSNLVVTTMDQEIMIYDAIHLLIKLLSAQILSVIEQKRNLIIFDIDHTILESIQGFHDAIPSKHSLISTGTPLSILWHQRKHFELFFIYKPYQLSIVFRKDFLRTLEYIHTNRGFLLIGPP